MGGDLFSEDEPGTPQTTGTGLMGRGYPGVVQDASVVIKAPVGTTLESIPLPAPQQAKGSSARMRRRPSRRARQGSTTSIRLSGSLARLWKR